MIVVTTSRADGDDDEDDARKGAAVWTGMKQLSGVDVDTEASRSVKNSISGSNYSFTD